MTVTASKIDKQYRDLYFESLGKKAYTSRIQSRMGIMEMESIGKAYNKGHDPRVHIDSKISSFLTCTKCDMMGSVTSDEGTSGSILEVECGTKISISDPERAWDQAEDPYKFQVEARVFNEELSDE